MSAPNDTGENAKTRPGSRSLLLAARVAVLLLAAFGAASALWLGRARDRAASVADGAEYVCPMHPDVTSAGPAQCPICGMDLERIDTAGAGSAGIDPSTYLNYDIMRRRGAGPDVPAPAWVAADGSVVAVLYGDELEDLAPDARALFYVPVKDAAQAGGGGGGEAKIEAAVALRAVPGARERWDRSTSHVRFRVDTPGNGELGAATVPALRAGRVGRVRLVDRGREVPSIPYSAVVESADGPYVFVLSTDGRTMTRRPIELGRISGGMALVVSGLTASDRVLTRSAFFVDAERKLRQKDTVEIRR